MTGRNTRLVARGVKVLSTLHSSFSTTIATTVWKFLRHPGPLLAVAVATFFVLAPSLRSNRGQHVIENDLLRLLFSLLALFTLIHLGDLLTSYLRLRWLASVVEERVATPGTPLLIPGEQPVLRRRIVLNQPLDQAQEAIFAWADQLYRGRPGVKIIDGEVTYVDEPMTSEPAGSGQETRRLLIGHQHLAAARVLFLAGLVIALGALWFSLTFGWNNTSDILAPGHTDTVQLPNRVLELSYRVPPAADGLSPHLLVALNEQQALLPLHGTPQSLRFPPWWDRFLGSNYTRLGNIGVWLEVKEPGLYVESNPLPMEAGGNAEPGHEGSQTLQTWPGDGVGFPSNSSEKDILLPDMDAFLRIVRRDEPALHFVVQVLRGPETIDQFTVEDDLLLPLPSLTDGRADPITLGFRPLPTVQAQVRYLPGYWLLLPAALLLLSGTLGFVRRPFFILIQLGPWAPDRSVLVVQSDRPGPLLNADYGTSR